jgi:molybdopterin-guanine dinucleotide biosynthesis protein A
MTPQTKVTGVILAGGKGRRMHEQDKGLMLFKGKPLVSYGIAAMTRVADVTLVNANRNIDAYREFGLPVISDRNGNFEGPLAGVLAAMASAQSGILLTLPCDSPAVQAGHLKHLLAGLTHSNADIAVASDGARLHPVFMAVQVAVMPNLADYLLQGGRKVEDWVRQHEWREISFADEKAVFNNINTLAELDAQNKAGRLE